MSDKDMKQQPQQRKWDGGFGDSSADKAKEFRVPTQESKRIFEEETQKELDNRDRQDFIDRCSVSLLSNPYFFEDCVNVGRKENQNITIEEQVQNLTKRISRISTAMAEERERRR